MRSCHRAATCIQRHGRGLLVRVALDRPGRELMRKQKVEMAALVQQKDSMTESMYIARTANLAAKARLALHRHRERNVDMRRSNASTLKSKHTRALDKQKKMKLKGSVQPQRNSVFEPMVV